MVKMVKIVRIGKLEDQDAIRRADVAALSPDRRVQIMLEQQARYLRWDLNPKIQRTAKLTRLNFKNVH